MVAHQECLDAMTEHLHPADYGLWLQMIPVAFEAARLNKIQLQRFLPCSTGRSRGTACTGWMQEHNGTICVMLRMRDGKGGPWLGRRPEAACWETLAHELAHFEQAKHGERHRALTANILQDINDIRERMRTGRPLLGGRP